jgi:phosphohistidine swiveling domain-containing protein
MTNPSVRWLEDIRSDELWQVGGKALNLARLCRAGFDVPRGFVVNTGSTLLGSENGLDLKTFPRDLQELVLSFYRQLDGPIVAVRSSAVAEDSPHASFAGQGQSILNVRTEPDLLHALVTVCNSMSKTATQSYAQKMDVSPVRLAVHVLVQEMIQAEFSGVLFTANPVSGKADEIVINATWGLAEPLVSGKITPDEIVVDKATGKRISSNIGSKELTMTAHGLEPTPAAKAASLCLQDEQVQHLLETALRIDRHFESAQDIEWAWDRKLHILQTRPLTTNTTATGEIAMADTNEEAERLWQEELNRLCSTRGIRSKVWVASGMAELLPCPTPLSFEVAARLMSGRQGYGLAQRHLGFDPAPGTILDRIAGHVYVDLDRESNLFFQHTALGYLPKEIQENPLRANLPRVTLRWRKLPGLLLHWPVLICQIARALVRQRRLCHEFPHFFTEWIPSFLDSVEKTRQQDLSGLEPRQLLAEFETRLDHFLTQSVPVLMTGSILSAMKYRELEDLLISRLGRGGMELAQRLMSGLKPNPTLEMHEAMCRVARGIESEDSFLRRFGHRCGGTEFELAVPRWREDPASLRAQIEQLQETQLAKEGATRQCEAAHKEADITLKGLSKDWGRVTCELMQTRLHTARELYPLRELSKNCLMMEFEVLRGPLVTLDRQLQLAGGIFYLGLSEIRDAIERPGAANKRIEERRRQHILYKQMTLPHVILGAQLSSSEPFGCASNANGLAGLGVSPGIARGRVRIVKSADDLPAVQEGEVLVVRSLEPTWTSAFLRAAGLVAQRGATLSHGAIVAREFALPAVVNVPEAMTRLKDGQEIKVNGTSGMVEVLGQTS